MKYALLLIVCITGISSSLQSQRKQRDPILDSLVYYNNELGRIQKASRDSMLNSVEYKSALAKKEAYQKQWKPAWGRATWFYFGGQVNDITNLNKRLEANGLKELESFLTTGGVGIGLRYKAVNIGVEGSVFMVGSSGSGNKASGFSFQGILSTNIFKTKKFIISPEIGYGLQSIRANIETNSSATNFDSYLTTSGNSISIKNENWFYNFALTYKQRNADDGGNIPLFRIGYRLGRKEEPWTVKGGNSSGAPLDRVNNFYFQVMLGFGD